MKQQLAFLILALAGALTNASAAAPEFFAMDTGTKDATHQAAEQQVALVQEVGFAGIAPIYQTPELLSDTLAALDQRKLKMFAVYVPLDLDSPAPVSPAIRDVIEQLRGRNAFLWLYVSFRAHKSSDPVGDAKAVPVMREVADLAKQAGVRVSLYPHLKNWVERVEDGARLAKQVDRGNFGVTFNLCHWLMVGDTDLDASLRAALPHLQMVTINGADTGNKELKACIQPLGSGTFDIGEVLAKLAGLGWNGPIGLQHFGIQGEAKTNLQRSMDAWRNLSRKAWPLSLKLEVLSTLPEPVIGKDTPGAETIPGGFEGGTTIKVETAGKKRYHQFSTGMGNLDWSENHMEYWVSDDGKEFQRKDVLRHQYVNKETGKTHQSLHPYPFFSEAENRWYMIFMEYVVEKQWDGQSGKIWCVPSKNNGPGGIEGPCGKRPGHESQRAHQWTGLLGGGV